MARWRLPAVVILLAGAVRLDGATAVLQPTGTYGQDQVVLENRFLVVTISPAQGARVVDMVDKRSGKHLTEMATPYDGFGKELVHDEQLPGEIMTASHQVAIAERGPQAAAATAEYAGRTQRTRGVVFKKTFRLVEGEPFLRIHYELRTPHVGVQNMGLRLHYVFTPGGRKDPQTARPFLPIVSGPRTARWNAVYRHYTHGWAAVVRPATAEGVVCLFDVDKAAQGFNWEEPTIEWYYRPVGLKPGLVWSDEVWIAPTQGLTIIDHADRTAVYEAGLSGRQLVLKLYGLQTGPVRVTPSLVGLDGRPVHAAPARDGSLTAGQVTTLAWDMPSAEVLRQTAVQVSVAFGAATASFLANPAELKDFRVPEPARGPVALQTEPVQRVTIDRPLEGPEISGSSPVQCEDAGWQSVEASKRPEAWRQAPAEVQERRIPLKTGPVDYGVVYWRVRAAPDKPWQAHLEGGSGLGLEGGNFYRGGFFDMEINGTRLRTAVPELALVRGSGKAAVDVRWEIAPAIVNLRLLALGGHSALYGQIDLSPHMPLTQIDVTFTAFPGGFHGQRDRRIRTAQGEFGHDRLLTFTPDCRWLLLYDRLLDPGTGAAAVAFVPEQVAQVRVQADSNYGVYPTISYKPAQRRVHFVLWSFCRAGNAYALERMQAEYGPALERLRTPERLFFVGHRLAAPTTKPAGVRLRVLELATFAHAESRWAHRHFEEFEQSEYLYTHKYGRPTRYEEFLRRMVESARYAFRANGQLAYHLRERPDIEVHTAYSNVFADYLSRLYDYDLVLINDLPLELLDPYEQDLSDYVHSGRGLVFLGGYGAYGGMGPGYGTWKGARLESLLPVIIERVPDFVEQTDYKKGIPGPWGPGRTRLCDYPEYRATWNGGFQRFGPVLPIMESLQWLGLGTTVTRVQEDHPVLAGVPLEMLAPDYHRVAARPGAQTLARLGHDPAVVVQSHGRGRLVALTFSDARRFWLWEHTPQFYSQLVEWAAGQPDRPVVSRLSIGHWGSAVGVELANPTSQPVTADLLVSQAGPCQRRRQQRQAQVQVAPGASRRLHFRFDDNPRFAPGPVQVTASWAGHVGHAVYENPPAALGPTLAIDAEHKRHFRRSDTIAPRVSVTGRVPPGATVAAELVGPDGRTVRAAPAQALSGPSDNLRLAMPADRLAYGPYGYRVSVWDRQGAELGSAAITVRVCRLVIPEYPILWYGYGAHSDGDTDCYLTLALWQRMAEQSNAIFSVGGWGLRNLEEACDQALGMNLALISYCVYAPAVAGDAPGVGRSPRHPSRQKALREAGLRQAGFQKHPAVHWFYIDDEGTGFSELDYDKEQFQKETGRAWPQDFASPQDHYDVTKFHLRGGHRMWQPVLDGLREVLPDRRHFFLQSVGNVAANGGWIWSNFEHSDINCIDLYPTTPEDYGECLFYYNAMRCLGYRNRRPGWIVLGEYRESFEMMRCQWWLALGSGLESHGWYSGGYGGASEGIGADRLHKIAPYDRRAMRYGPLLARWDKPRSRVALYWSLGSCAQRGPGDSPDAIRRPGWQVGKACVAAAQELYRHDLYPDVITEDEVLADQHLAYDAIVLAGVTWDTPAVLDKLTAFAARRLVMLDRQCTIKLAGAAPLDGAALAARVPPAVLTPDPLVHAEPLRAGAQHYLILYNHQPKAVEADVIVRQPDVKAVYDVFEHQALPVQTKAAATRLTVRLEAYDGRLLALCPAALPDVRVTAGDAVAGADLAVEIRAGLDSKDGVVPVEVAVLDPSGRRTVYGGPFAVVGGCSRYTIDFGINDPPGAWQVRVEDLITGKTAAATIRLAVK